MNVYQMLPDGSDRRWVWLAPRAGQEVPPWERNPANMSEFYERNPVVCAKRAEEAVGEGEGQPEIQKQLPDCSNVAGWGDLALSEKAKLCLAPRIDGLGRWIRVDLEEAPYWLFWLTHEVDALDEAASRLVLFADGSLMRIARFAFKSEAIENELLFTIKQQAGRHQFVTDAFLDLVRKYQLTGFKFVPVWSSKEGSLVPDHNDPAVWRTGLELPVRSEC
jgi:hypothetical protein